MTTPDRLKYPVVELLSDNGFDDEAKFFAEVAKIQLKILTKLEKKDYESLYELVHPYAPSTTKAKLAVEWLQKNKLIKKVVNRRRSRSNLDYNNPFDPWGSLYANYVYINAYRITLKGKAIIDGLRTTEPQPGS